MIKIHDPRNSQKPHAKNCFATAWVLAVLSLFAAGNFKRTYASPQLPQGSIAQTLAILTNSLPKGGRYVPYHATLLGNGGSGKYHWQIILGQVPQGLYLNPSAGTIDGTPTMAGEFNLVIQLVDRQFPLNLVTAATTLSIETPAPSDPELPRLFVYTGIPDIRNYTVIHVQAGADLQMAIDNASCAPMGTILALASGAAFEGNFKLPAKTCAPDKWIIIRTDIADSKLPHGMTRISPSYSPILAKILTDSVAPAIATARGASHYRFIGVEIGATSTVTFNYGLIVVGKGETDVSTVPNHIYVDRCYIHGNATGNIQRGMSMNGAYLAAVNSYFENFHYVGVDSQAISAWNGPGPLKIVNNYLEASGENVLWGGSRPTILNNIQSDIEIRLNHFFKPLTWKTNDPSYAGIHWTVKNLLEFKCAQRVLVEGNVMENNWGDAQAGFAVLFTPRGMQGTCPACTAADITFRYNILRHSGNGFDIGGEDSNPPSQPSQRVFIHDNLMTDINGPAWNGAGILYQIINGGKLNNRLPPHDITIDHNTGFQNQHFVFSGDHAGNYILNFVFTNNIQPHNQGGLAGTGTSTGIPTLTAYTLNFSVTNNVIDGLPTGLPPSAYPPNNFFPTDFSSASIGFKDFAGGDFQLLPTSPFSAAGTDGKDIGADVSALNSATAGVAP